MRKKRTRIVQEILRQEEEQATKWRNKIVGVAFYLTAFEVLMLLLLLLFRPDSYMRQLHHRALDALTTKEVVRSTFITQAIIKLLKFWSNAVLPCIFLSFCVSLVLATFTQVYAGWLSLSGGGLLSTVVSGFGLRGMLPWLVIMMGVKGKGDKVQGLIFTCQICSFCLMSYIYYSLD